jgi:hypothetical protein
MFSEFYKEPEGYFQILSESGLNSCSHKNFKDETGYTFSNGKNSIIRKCNDCSASKKYSSYLK